MTGDLTVNDVDLFHVVMLRLDQHVSSNDTLHQDLTRHGCGLVFILSNQQCRNSNVIIYVWNQRVDFQSWNVELRRR